MTKPKIDRNFLYFKIFILSLAFALLMYTVIAGLNQYEFPGEKSMQENSQNLEDTKPKTLEIKIQVNNNNVTVKDTLTVKQDQEVRLVVLSDTVDDVHLHGYDILKNVTPQKPAIIEFKAQSAGLYELEFENSGLLLGKIRVEPK